MLKPDPNPPLSPVPLVSVSITAYNLEKLLPRAIDSVLKQQTNLPFEIVICDDCSKDSTLSIALSYQERHPNLIRVLEQSTNAGIQRNTYDTLEQCRGKYIAWLDADDYWTDPDKLNIQVAALESDPSLNICAHLVRWVTADGEIAREIYPSVPPGRYGLAEILRHNFLPTPSVMFRNGTHRQLPSWYFEIKSLSDWPIWILSALSGDIILLDRVMADYMLTPGSSFMSKGDLYWYKADAELYALVEGILPPKYKKLARSEAGKRYEAIAYSLQKQGDFSTSREAALKAFHLPSLADNFSSKTKALLAAFLRETEWKLKGGQTGIPPK
jgi:glycosyltransferase involved in cell wall biosynthesis